MRDPEAKFRGKPLSGMSLSQLIEIRDLTASSGFWFDGPTEHMERLAVIDEFIRAKKEAKDSQ